MTSVIVATTSSASTANVLASSAIITAASTATAILVSITSEATVEAAVVVRLAFLTSLVVVVPRNSRGLENARFLKCAYLPIVTAAVIITTPLALTALVIVVTSAVSLPASIAPAEPAASVAHVSGHTKGLLVQFFLGLPVRSVIPAFGLFGGLAGNAVEERLLLVIEHFGVGFRFGLVSLDLAFFHLVVLHVGVPVGGLRLKTAFL